MKAYIWPYITGWATSLVSALLFFVGTLHEELFVAVSMAGLVSFFVGSLIGFVLTDLIYGYEVNRIEFKGIPDLTKLELEDYAIQAVSNDLTEGDYFYGINPIKLQEIAKNILANRNFTFATVGQTERPKLVEPFKAAQYIVYVGNGKYDVTPKGYRFFEALVANNPKSIVFRKLLSNKWNYL